MPLSPTHPHILFTFISIECLTLFWLHRCFCLAASHSLSRFLSLFVFSLVQPRMWVPWCDWVMTSWATKRYPSNSPTTPRYVHNSCNHQTNLQINAPTNKPTNLYYPHSLFPTIFLHCRHLPTPNPLQSLLYSPCHPLSRVVVYFAIVFASSLSLTYMATNEAWIPLLLLLVLVHCLQPPMLRMKSPICWGYWRKYMSRHHPPLLHHQHIIMPMPYNREIGHTVPYLGNKVVMDK